MAFGLLVLLLGLPAAGDSPWPELPLDACTGGGGADAAVVVAVEQYAYLPAVTGATRNSLDWYSYFTKVRGVPPRQVRLLEDSDATPSKVREALLDAASRVGARGTLWFVFIGHGAPSRDGNDGVLVCVDAHADEIDFYQDALPRSEVLGLLRTARCRQRVVILDACFSGLDTAGGQLLIGVQFTVPAAHAEVIDATILAAGRPHDIAGPLPGEARPAFTYLVLGGLLGWADSDADRRVTAAEAVTYAKNTLRTLDNRRRQQPTLAGDDRILTDRLVTLAPPPDLADLRIRLRETPPLQIVPPPRIEGAGPNIDRAAVTAAVADVTVEAEPAKRVSLEVTDPAGKTVVSGTPFRNRQGKPGVWQVRATAPGYQPVQTAFPASPDHKTVWKIILDRLGGLSVSGTPKGADVSVSGPGGFADSGGLPWKAKGLTSGTYKVKVTRDGYKDMEHTVEVRAGATVSVPVLLSRIVEPKKATGSSRKRGAGKKIEWVRSRAAGLRFAKTETTVAQYTACVRADRCPTDGFSSGVGCGGRALDDDDRPVSCVRWADAKAFCAWAGGRLPTEDEWHAEASAQENRRYPWGAAPIDCRLAWVNHDVTGPGCGTEGPQGVCITEGRSVSGLCDMAGNLWEWTGTREGEDVVLCGGSWRDLSGMAMVSGRNWQAPGTQSDAIGFRCVK